MADPDLAAALDLIAHRPFPPGPQLPVRVVAVLGGSTLAGLAAAEALAAGIETRLCSVFGRQVDRLRASRSITVRGCYLVGTYQVVEDAGHRAGPAIQLCRAVDEAVDDADVVVVAAAASELPVYADLLAASTDGQPAVLAIDGGFLAAAVLAKSFGRFGAGRPVLAETSGSPYLARVDGGAIVLDAMPVAVGLGALGPVTVAAGLADRLRPIWSSLRPLPSVLDAAFADVSCVTLAAPAVLAAGRRGGARRELRDLVPAALAATVLADLDHERRTVAAAFGVAGLPPAAEALATGLGVGVPDRTTLTGLLEASPELANLAVDTSPAAVADAVESRLVPLAGAGDLAGVATPVTDALIVVASSLTGRNLATSGRSVVSLGRWQDPSELRRELVAVGTTAHQSLDPTVGRA